MVVEQLARAGLVGRRRNRDDRRYQEVFLTEAGKEIISEYFPRYARTLAEEFSVLGEEEQRYLGDLCKKLGFKEKQQ